MKKLFTILLSFCFVLPAFAGNVGAVNNDAWLEHIAQMQSLRQQIMGLVSKSNPTFEDRDKLAVLKQDFNDRKASWDAYLVEVAEGRAVEPADTTVAPATECSQQNSEKMDCSSRKNCCKDKKHECTDACKDICKAACCGVKGCEGKEKKMNCTDACKDTCKAACCGVKGCEGKEKKMNCSDDRKDKCKEKKMKCGSRKNCKGNGKKDECGKKSEKKSCTPKNTKCGGC